MSDAYSIFAGSEAAGSVHKVAVIGKGNFVTSRLSHAGSIYFSISGGKSRGKVCRPTPIADR